MPKARIKIKVINAAKGNTKATVIAARIFPKNKPSNMITRMVDSNNEVDTALTALVTSDALS